MSNRLIAKVDVRYGLPLADKSVQCVVTSPPYWGLRNYGDPRQMGSEPTPGAYVAGMVALFREVWRVLRDDGTVFLNIGDSYFGSGKGGNPEDSLHQKQRSNAGSLTVAGGVRRANACGTSGKAPEDSTGRDCLCGSLCGACRVAYQIGKSHSDSALAPTPSPSPCGSIHEHTGSPIGHLPTSDSSTPADRSEAATLDLAPSPAPDGERLPASPPSTIDGSSPRRPEDCRPSGQPSGCRLCGQPLEHSAREFGRKTACPCGQPRASISTPGHPASTGGNVGIDGSSGDRKQGMACDLAYPDYTKSSRHPQLKPKDLVGIPWMVAFALRDAGWYLRSDSILFKRNPMPESVTDRPTKAHEYVFLLAKSDRYYFDHVAVQDKASQPIGEARRTGQIKSAILGQSDKGMLGSNQGAESRNMRTVLQIDEDEWVQFLAWKADRAAEAAGPDVWDIPLNPFKGAHFATMPRALARKCLLAGTSAKGCCPACRAPWRRTIAKDRAATRPGLESKVYATAPVRPDSPVRTHNGDICGNRDPARHVTTTRTIGWGPSCGCDAGDPVPCRVLDPFNGAGTTGVEAASLGLDYLGTDVNADYLRIAKRRIDRPHAPIERSVVIEEPLPLFG